MVECRVVVGGEVAGVVKELGAGVTPIEAWIDADGVIRRLEVRLATPANDGPGAVVTTIELYDIGAAVDIAVPAVARRER